MSTTLSIASLTVSELRFQAQASLSADYSLVEALSDAGVYMPQDQNRHGPGRPQPNDNTVYLWENGCQLFSGAWDCTTACTNPSLGPRLLWNASHDPGLTYHNCLVYPIIAKSAAQNWLDEGSRKLLDKYGIVPNATLPSRFLTEMKLPVENMSGRGLLSITADKDCAVTCFLIGKAAHYRLRMGRLGSNWVLRIVLGRLNW